MNGDAAGSTDEDIDEGMIEVYSAPLPDLHAIVQPLAFRNTPIELFIAVLDRNFKVSFDRASGGNDRQRAFVKCPYHSMCRRYVYCDTFDSHGRAAAWLFAWTFSQPRSACQKTHFQTEPTDELVDSYLVHTAGN